MDAEQAAKVVRTLIAPFPRHGLNDEGLTMYADSIEASGAEYGRAHEIAMRWARTHGFMPSLHEFLAVITPRQEVVVSDPDAVEIHPEVQRGMIEMLRDKLRETDARRSGRGVDGHWHGGPDPCPVCGGMKGLVFT